VVENYSVIVFKRKICPVNSGLEVILNALMVQVLTNYIILGACLISVELLKFVLKKKIAISKSLTILVKQTSYSVVMGSKVVKSCDCLSKINASFSSHCSYSFRDKLNLLRSRSGF